MTDHQGGCHSELAAEAVRALCHQLLDEPVEPGDLYRHIGNLRDLAGRTSDALRRLADLAERHAHTTGIYHDDGGDPVVELATGAARLRTAATQIAAGEHVLSDAHSSLSHIGVRAST